MSQRINLLYITTSLSTYGGIEETLRILCGRLDPGRFRIGVCTIKDRPGEVLTVFGEMGIEIFCLGRKGYFFDLLTTLKILRLIRRYRADIVHTHTNKGNLHGRIAAYLARKPLIVTTHHDFGDIGFSKNPKHKKKGPSSIEADHFRNPYNWVYAFLYPFLNVKLNALNAKIIAVSHAVRSVYTCTSDDQRFETVHAPFDDNLFTPKYDGFGNRRIVLGTVGRFSGQKGHLYLLRSLKLLVQTRSDIELRFIGDGPLKPKIKRYIEHNELGRFVQLCGSLPHNSRLYDGIDIYIQPSGAEGCSITLLEAMGVGIPVVAMDMGGPRELIIADKTGILVPPKNPLALKEAILRLIGDQKKALELGRSGQQRAREHFSAGIFIQKMTYIYQALVDV